MTTTARSSALTLYVLLVLALVGSLIFGWWEAFDGDISYADVEEFGNSYWPMNLLLFGPSYIVQTVSVAIFLVVLGRGRGFWIALAGALVLALSGIVFALAATAEALPFDWAVNHGLLDEPAGRLAVERWNDYLDSWFGWVLVPMAGIAVGTLIAVIGAIVSGRLRWWWAPLVVAVIGLIFGAPMGSVLGNIASVVQCVLWAMLGWHGVRAWGSDE